MKNLNLRIFLNALPIQLALFLALIVIFWSGGSKAQINKGEQSKETISTDTKPSPNPQMTEEHLAEIKQAREEFMLAPTAPCAPTAPIAFSVLGFSDISGINDTVLRYDKSLSDVVITNEGNAWRNSGSMFIAPCDGLYFMTISAERDSDFGATRDDVWMYMVVSPVAGPRKIIDGDAWMGEGTGVARTSAAYSVVYRLRAGDIVQTWVYSDGPTNNQFKRHLMQFAFSGFLVAP